MPKLDERADLTGLRSGKLTVTGHAGVRRLANGRTRHYWVAACDCGGTVEANRSNLLFGCVRSCGCSRRGRGHSRNAIDLTGRTFGRLTVIERAELALGERPRFARWRCRCECGAATVVRAAELRGGSTRSCGCLMRDVCSAKARTHGESKCAPEYKSWSSIKARCYRSNHVYFKHYGGRGILMCDRWRDSYEAFLEDMGRKPSPKHSVDRIDNDGNYEPGNCKWSTMKEQSRNTRHNSLLTIKGRTMSAIEWAEEVGINYNTLQRRVRAGWPHDEAVYAPTDRRRPRPTAPPTTSAEPRRFAPG